MRALAAAAQLLVRNIAATADAAPQHGRAVAARFVNTSATEHPNSSSKPKKEQTDSPFGTTITPGPIGGAVPGPNAPSRDQTDPRATSAIPSPSVGGGDDMSSSLASDKGQLGPGAVSGGKQGDKALQSDKEAMQSIKERASPGQGAEQ